MIVVRKRVHLFVRAVFISSVIGGIFLSGSSYAKEFNESKKISVEGGVTAVAQSTNDSSVDAELFASVDLAVTIPAGNGEWLVYIEGNSTPKTNGVSSVIGEANGDAGSALNRDGKGRLQVSELHYTLPVKSGVLTAGLLDVTAILDTSDVANDETSQFLNASLVGNPTIEFPDYTLGFLYNTEFDEGKSLSLALTSSNGLGDNTNVSYSELVDISENGKGVFAAAEILWPVSDLQLRVGVWVNTADHAKLSGTSGTTNNYGVYALVDGKVGAGQWSIRGGIANDKVSRAANFISAAVQYPTPQLPSNATFGAGVTHTSISDNGKGAQEDDSVQAEVYVRFDMSDSLSVTPSLQLIKNSDFDASGTNFDENQTLFSVRLNYAF